MTLDEKNKNDLIVYNFLANKNSDMELTVEEIKALPDCIYVSSIFKEGAYRLSDVALNNLERLICIREAINDAKVYKKDIEDEFIALFIKHNGKEQVYASYIKNLRNCSRLLISSEIDIIIECAEVLEALNEQPELKQKYEKIFFNIHNIDVLKLEMAFQAALSELEVAIALVEPFVGHDEDFNRFCQYIETIKEKDICLYLYFLNYDDLPSNIYEFIIKIKGKENKNKFHNVLDALNKLFASFPNYVQVHAKIDKILLGFVSKNKDLSMPGYYDLLAKYPGREEFLAEKVIELFNLGIKASYLLYGIFDKHNNSELEELVEIIASDKRYYFYDMSSPLYGFQFELQDDKHVIDLVKLKHDKIKFDLFKLRHDKYEFDNVKAAFKENIIDIKKALPGNKNKVLREELQLFLAEILELNRDKVEDDLELAVEIVDTAQGLTNKLYSCTPNRFILPIIKALDFLLTFLGKCFKQDWGFAYVKQAQIDKFQYSIQHFIEHIPALLWQQQKYNNSELFNTDVYKNDSSDDETIENNFGSQLGPA